MAKPINYELDYDEVVLVECKNIYLDDNSFANQMGNLVLTNKNIIWLLFNFWNNPKSLTKYSLQNIKVFNNVPQIQITEKWGTPSSVTVYLTNGELRYSISDKQTARDFVSAAKKVITGEVEEIETERLSIPGSQTAARVIKGTIDNFKDVFAKKPDQTATKCPSCGASVTGIKGKVIKCQFCDTMIQL